VAKRYGPAVEPPPTRPPDPAGPPPAPSGQHGLRNGLLLASGLVVLAVVVLVVAAVVVLHRVGDAVGTAARDVGPDNPGAPDQVSLTEGSAFTFHDQRFHSGWRLARSGDEGVPEGLDFTSEDDSSQAAVGYLDVRLYHLGRYVGVSHCHSEDSLEPGSPNAMTCSGVVLRETPIDRFDVADFHLSY
jgi:hypothetical protein